MLFLEALLTSIHTAISQSREDRLQRGPTGQGQGCLQGQGLGRITGGWSGGPPFHRHKMHFDIKIGVRYSESMQGLDSLLFLECHK